jgi:hypothetical protein
MDFSETYILYRFQPCGKLLLIFAGEFLFLAPRQGNCTYRCLIFMAVSAGSPMRFLVQRVDKRFYGTLVVRGSAAAQFAEILGRERADGSRRFLFLVLI